MASHAVLVLFFVHWVIRKDYKKYGYALKQKPSWLPALMYGMIVVGFFIADHKSKALSYLSISLPYLVPAVIIASPPVEERQFLHIVRAFIISLAVCLLTADLYALFDIWKSGEAYTVTDGIYTYHKLSSYGLTRVFSNWHPTYVATFCLWCIGFIVSGSRTESPSRLFTSIPSVGLVLVFIVNIILLNSIAVMGALVILAGVWLVKYLAGRNLNRIYLVMAVLVLGFGTAFLVYDNPFNNTKITTLKERGIRITDKEGERNVLTIRMAKWLTHFEIFKKHPLFGVTAGDIREERLKMYRAEGFDSLAAVNFNAHNQYLEVLSRFGIIGFIIFVAFLLYPVCLKPTSPFYLTILISVAIVFMTESFLERQQGLLAFLFFYGLFNKVMLRNKQGV